MSQPALLRPARTHLEAAPPATYGGLMAATHEAVEDALALGAQRLPDPETGASELAGYERFLRYAGAHIETLMRLAEVRNDGISRLAMRLSQLHDPDPDDQHPSRWLHAATLLGTGHDLLATHLTGVGVPRTAECEDMLTGPALVRGGVEVAQLILTAVDGCHELLGRAARAQDGHPVKVIPSKTFARLHASNRAASLAARAALWDLHTHTVGLPTGRLDQLMPAIALDGPRPPAFETSLAALRLLRHYSYAQAHGRTPASPASLRDLARLGAHLTNPDHVLEALPEPGTSLHRLQRAHLSDQLTAAHRAWTDAAGELTRSIQGLTRAPAGYGAAIGHLLDIDLHDLSPALHRTLGTALPRMGTEAAATVNHLAERSELVTLQRPPLATRHQWRPIRPEHAETIAATFSTAAHSTRRAFAALDAADTPRRPSEPAPRPASPRLERTRQVHR